MTLEQRRLELLAFATLHEHCYGEGCVFREILQRINYFAALRTYGNDKEREKAIKELKDLGVDE